MLAVERGNVILVELSIELCAMVFSPNFPNFGTVVFFGIVCFTIIISVDDTDDVGNISVVYLAEIKRRLKYVRA